MEYAWFAMVALCLSMYVLLDGYDLGIGTLTLFQRDPLNRREMVELLATAWDGNETWLILFAVGAWAGLPGAFGVMLPGLFLPLIVMLFSLILRGAAIEFISAGSGVPRGWGLAFGGGSLVASYAQGMAIGGLLSGVTQTNGVYTGGAFDFFTSYSVLTGLGAVLLYMTAGAAVLRYKTEGELRRQSGVVGRVTLAFTAGLALLAALSLAATATPLHLHSGWRIALFILALVVAVVGLITAASGFADGPDWRALVGVVTAEAACVLGLLTLILPVIVPPSITIHSARAPGMDFPLLAIGVGLNIPLVLFYGWYSHHVFRGKYRLPGSARPLGLSATAQALSGTTSTNGAKP
jgi:cytochrome d ubiquinol oxidase subunit II